MKSIIIPLNDWAAGERKFHAHADLEFFQQFDNSEILDANVSVEIRVVKDGRNKVEADLHLKGTVTVPCDRCLDDLEIEVAADFEDTYTPESDELDLSQDVYDYVCTAIPLQRVHPDGECNPETIKFLSK